MYAHMDWCVRCVQSNRVMWLVADFSSRFGFFFRCDYTADENGSTREVATMAVGCLLHVRRLPFAFCHLFIFVRFVVRLLYSICSYWHNRLLPVSTSVRSPSLSFSPREYKRAHTHTLRRTFTPPSCPIANRTYECVFHMPRSHISVALITMQAHPSRAIFLLCCFRAIINGVCVCVSWMSSRGSSCTCISI